MTWDRSATIAILIGLLATVSICSGCGRSNQSAINNYDPATAAAKAIEAYDRNGDGKLSAEEVKASPGLTEGSSRIDKNHDGVLTSDELEARFHALESQAHFILLHVDVSLKGAPLAGASVTFVPEPFMGDGLQSYVGTSTDAGVCGLKGEKKDTLGLPIGFYQMKIVHPGHSINTVRGVEIADDTTGNRFVIAL